MMSLWDALRMNMMISYQELVRTFLSLNVSLLSALGLCNRDKSDLRRLGEQKYNLHLNNNIH